LKTHEFSRKVPEIDLRRPAKILFVVGSHINKYRRSYLTIDCAQPVVKIVFFDAISFEFDLRHYGDLYWTEEEGCGYLDVCACREEAETIAAEARSKFRAELELREGVIIEVEGVKYRRIEG